MKKELEFFNQYYLPIYRDMVKAKDNVVNKLTSEKDKTKKTILNLVQFIIDFRANIRQNYDEKYGTLGKELKAQKLELLYGHFVLYYIQHLTNEKAAVAMEEALKLGEKYKDIDLIYNCHLRFAQIYYLLNVRDKAIHHLNAIDDKLCLGKFEMEALLVNKYSQLMRFHYLNEKNDEAIACELFAKKLIEKSKFSFHVTLNFYSHQADLHGILKKEEGLLNLKREIKKLYKLPLYKDGTKMSALHFYSNAITNFTIKNNLSKAEIDKWSHEQLYIFSELEKVYQNPLHINTQYLQQATLHYNLGHYKEAITYLAKAFRFFSTYLDNTNYLYLHYTAAKIYSAMSKDNQNLNGLYKITRHWDKALDISQKQKSEQLKTRVEKLTKEHELEKEKIKASQLQKELKMTSLHLQEKINTLDELKKYVNSLKKTDYQMGKLILTISNKIESIKVSEEERSVLMHKIDNSDVDFARKLAEKHPSLSALEVRMCGLFKTGMNNKELSKLFGLSDRSYEQHRYRIKKKMNLSADDGLVAHLNNL